MNVYYRLPVCKWYGLLLHLCMMACTAPHQMAVAHMSVLLISPHKTHQPKFGHTFYRVNCARRDQQMAKWIFCPRSAVALVGPQMTRRVKRHNTVPLSFADGYPYLLANEASLRDLQQRCPASVNGTSATVVSASAWEEDSCKVIRIGDVVFDVVNRSCCIFTTVSPEKGQKHPAGEPLKTLQSFRTAQDNGDVDFGQNLIARNSGVIYVTRLKFGNGSGENYAAATRCINHRDDTGCECRY